MEITGILERSLEKWKQDKSELVIFLQNGIRLTGGIKDFDKEAIHILPPSSKINEERFGSIVMISAISTVTLCNKEHIIIPGQ